MDGLKKVFLAGIGAVTMSKEKAKGIIDELVVQGKVKEKEGRQLMEEMLTRAASLRKEVEKNVSSQVNTAYTKVNLATQEQIRKMEKRLHELEKELAKKNPKAGIGKKGKAVGKKNK